MLFSLFSFLEPPLVNLEFESPVRAQLMGVVKITCPVRQSDDQSELMFNWIKVHLHKTINV